MMIKKTSQCRSGIDEWFYSGLDGAFESEKWWRVYLKIPQNTIIMNSVFSQIKKLKFHLHKLELSFDLYIEKNYYIPVISRFLYFLFGF